MKQRPYELDSHSPAVVLQTLAEVCSYRGWNLLAAPLRTNHVHVIVEAGVPPEKVRNDFKTCASTRWLWKDHDVREAIRYVVEEQGEPMAVFLGDLP